MKEAKQIAPLQLVAIAFSEPNFEGKILQELERLRDINAIRVVDALAVEKDVDGIITAVQVSDLPRGEAAEYGAIIGWLIGIGFGDEEVAGDMALKGAMLADSEYEYGMDPEELESLVEDIPEGGAAALLLIEHVWVLPLKQAVHDAGGTIVTQDFLSFETLTGIGERAFEAIGNK